MEHDPAIRIAHGGDVDRIMVVMDAAFDPIFGEKWTAGQLRSSLIMPHNHILIYVCDTTNLVKAFLIYRSIGTESEMLMLAVLPDARGQGIACTLMDAWERACHNYDIADLFLEVRENNPAIKLYIQSGFEKVGVRLSYYRGIDGQNYDAHTMRKKI